MEFCEDHFGGVAGLDPVFSRRVQSVAQVGLVGVQLRRCNWRPKLDRMQQKPKLSQLNFLYYSFKRLNNLSND